MQNPRTSIMWNGSLVDTTGIGLQLDAAGVKRVEPNTYEESYTTQPSQPFQEDGAIFNSYGTEIMVFIAVVLLVIFRKRK